MVTLVCVVYGEIYERYAAAMWESAREHFHPSAAVQLLELPGVPGWPAASGDRYRIVADNARLIEGDHVYMIDADMRFEAPVGPEILPPSGVGLVACIHPGFPDLGQADAPWNQGRDPHGMLGPDSLAWVPTERQQGRYHPGAFVGGDRSSFLLMAGRIDCWTQLDRAAGLNPRWYDEAYLNAYLANPFHGPVATLPPGFCAWDYWGADQTRVIVHLDKTVSEFHWRGQVDQSAAVAADVLAVKP
jgi:hypothetical protein